MNMKKVSKIIVACLAAFACLCMTGAADVRSNTMELSELSREVVDASRIEYTVARAGGNLNTDISANAVVYVNGDFTLRANDIVTFDCSYTPRSASVDFGVVAPDGQFYYVNSTSGSINKSIRVNQRGTYTIAIANNSSYKVNVVGDVSY